MILPRSGGHFCMALLVTMIIRFFVIVLVLDLMIVVIWCGQQPTLQGSIPPSRVVSAKPTRQGGGRTRIRIAILVIIRNES